MDICLGHLVEIDLQLSHSTIASEFLYVFSPNEIKDMLNQVGFDNTRVVNLLEDVATIHIGQKS